MNDAITISYTSFVFLLCLATTGGLGLVVLIAATIAAILKKK